MIGRTPFILEIEELDERDRGSSTAGEGYRIEHLPTRHSVPSLAFALVEDERPGAFDVAAARALGVEEGPEFGRLQRGEAVTTAAGRTVRPAEVLGPPRRRTDRRGHRRHRALRRPCSRPPRGARCSCTRRPSSTRSATARARRATRPPARRRRSRRDADVGLLVLTHLSSRHAPREVREEAEREFPRVLVPRDFDQVEVPFPERGEPIVHPARGRRGGADAPSEAPATVAPIDL